MNTNTDDPGAPLLKPAQKPAKPSTESRLRDARLKAALKANMARRKGQARARTVDDETVETDGGHSPADAAKNG